MERLKELKALGTELGLEGKELTAFVTEQQEFEREARREARQA